jgi:hypothetical protein
MSLRPLLICNVFCYRESDMKLTEMKIHIFWDVTDLAEQSRAVQFL